MNEIDLRCATWDDAALIVDFLRHLGYPQDMTRFLQVYQELLKESCLEITLATQGERHLGLLTLRGTMSLRLAGPVLSIEELVVLPEARDRGVGSSLIAWAQERTRLYGALRLEVQTSRERESYRRSFYTKNGFVPAESCVLRWDPRALADEEQDNGQTQKGPETA